MLHLCHFGHHTSKNLKKSQKYIDDLSCFMMVSNKLESHGSKDVDEDHEDDEPPHVRECRRQNFTQVTEMWEALKCILASIEKNSDQRKSIYGKNDKEISLSLTSSFSACSDSFKMSFQRMLCICLNMKEFPLDFILFLLKIAPKTRKRVVLSDNNPTNNALPNTESIVDTTYAEQGQCDIPLHIALDQMQKNGISSQMVYLIQELVKMDSTATEVRNAHGQLPLTLILRLGAQWDEGVKGIFLANPIAFLDQEDEKFNKAEVGREEKRGDLSRLLPFLLERVSNEGYFHSLYGFIREKPELVSSYR